jgi:hypothetical protein
LAVCAAIYFVALCIWRIAEYAVSVRLVFPAVI